MYVQFMFKIAQNINNPLKPDDDEMIMGISKEDNKRFMNFIYTKRYRVADTGLTYRQINNLGEKGIFKDNRSDRKQWHEFSIHDLLFFKLLEKCRMFGLNNEQVKDLSDCFYNKETKDKEDLLETSNWTNSDLAIRATISGIKISLLIFPSEYTPEPSKKTFVAHFVNIDHQAFLDRFVHSYFYIDFNSVLREVLNKILVNNTRDLVPESNDWLKRMVDNANLLSAKEWKMLDIIKKQEYTKITIKKDKNNEVLNVYGEGINEMSNLSKKEVIDLIYNRDYQNIRIQVRGNSVVDCQLQEVYKL